MHRHLMILALLLCPAGSLFSQAGTKAVVEVVGGKAQYKSGEQVLPITKGMTLKEGETVLTGSGQLVILRLDNGGQLVVYQNSEMTMKSKDKKPTEAILDLPTGFLWVRVPKLKKDSSLQVDMPSASAGNALVIFAL